MGVFGMQNAFIFGPFLFVFFMMTMITMIIMYIFTKKEGNVKWKQTYRTQHTHTEGDRETDSHKQTKKKHENNSHI